MISLTSHILIALVEIDPDLKKMLTFYSRLHLLQKGHITELCFLTLHKETPQYADMNSYYVTKVHEEPLYFNNQLEVIGASL